MIRIPVCGISIRDHAGRGCGACLSYRTAGFQSRFLYSFISVESNKVCIESRIAWHIMRREFPLTDIVDIRCRHTIPFAFTVVVHLYSEGDICITVWNRLEMNRVIRALSRAHP